MRVVRSLIILAICGSASSYQVALAQARHWKWEPPYDPPHTLVPVLKEKGISIQRWRFCEAIGYQTLELVLQMLEQGSDPNMTCDRFFSGEMPAIFQALVVPGAKPEIVRALVAKGANVNLRYTPIVEQEKNNLSAMEKLMQRAMSALADTDYFPLYYAAQRTNPSVVQALLELGADVHARTGVHRMTAMLAARDADMGKVLVRFGANVNDKDAAGRSVLNGARRSLGDLMEGHHLRPKYEAYVAWLKSVGARE